MQRILLGSTLVIALTATAGVAAAADDASRTVYAVDQAHSDVTFKVRHLMSRTGGEFTDFDGTFAIDWSNPDRSKVEFEIDAASIDTANADRDKHLRSEDFFWVEKHPKITFTSDSIEKKSDQLYHVHGTLTMRGVANKVTLPVTYLGELQDPWGNTKAGFSTEITLDRKDYDIVWNKALDAGGVILGDDVEVTIDLQTAKK
jgi:polyisoprenoid-binding protein YceI